MATATTAWCNPDICLVSTELHASFGQADQCSRGAITQERDAKLLVRPWFARVFAHWHLDWTATHAMPRSLGECCFYILKGSLREQNPFVICGGGDILPRSRAKRWKSLPGRHTQQFAGDQQNTHTLVPFGHLFSADVALFGNRKFLEISKNRNFENAALAIPGTLWDTLWHWLSWHAGYSWDTDYSWDSDYLGDTGYFWDAGSGTLAEHFTEIFRKFPK